MRARPPAHFDRLESRRLLAVVSGFVFEDANADGIVNEPFRVPSATVYADLNDNGAREAPEPSAVSDADGNYQRRTTTRSARGTSRGIGAGTGW